MEEKKFWEETYYIDLYIAEIIYKSFCEDIFSKSTIQIYHLNLTMLNDFCLILMH
jgi:hypothetical protein